MTDALLIAKAADKPIELLPRLANRHGLITGATGTGKTVTLQKLAESFAGIGVPVFMADIKGDLSGVGVAGAPSDKLMQRLAAKEQRQKQPVGFQRAETLYHLADRIIGPMQRHRMDHRILCAGAQIKHRLVRGLRDPGQHFGPEIRVSAQQYRRRKPPVNRGQSFLDLVSGLFQQEEGGRRAECATAGAVP